MKEINIYYIFQERFPSETAAALCAAKTAQAFGKQGVNMFVLAGRRLKRSNQDPADFYALDKGYFKTVYLPTIDLMTIMSGAVAFYLITFSYIFSTLIYLLLHGKKDKVIYTNEKIPALILSFFFKKVFFELHDYPRSKKWLHKFLLKRMTYILTTNNWKLDNLKKDFKILAEKLILERNAIDLSEFTPRLTKEEARKKLNLPLKNKIVLYTGHLFSWKGVDTLALATKKLASDTLVYIVGGKDKDIENFKAKYNKIKNLKVMGYRPHSEMSAWQWAADVMVIPNTAKEQISLYDTSPMKLFEYMATETTPMIVSDIPSITEVANDDNAIIVKPDDPDVLSLAIKKVLAGDYSQQAKQAFADVQYYTWDKRAERILDRFFRFEK